MPTQTISVTTKGLILPSHARWHDGALWVADTLAGALVRIDDEGEVAESIDVPGGPGGFDWTDDGTLLVASCAERRLLRREGDTFETFADLWDLSPHDCSGMAVSPTGHIYVTNVGFDYVGGASPQSTTIVGVDPDGKTWLAAEGLLLPSELLVDRSSKTLLVTESLGRRIVAFQIDDDGSLGESRIWADLRPNVPNGACLDPDGAVWAADPVNRGAMRVIEKIGAVDWVETSAGRAYACAIGGEALDTLFLCTAPTSDPAKAVELHDGGIEAAVVR